MLLDPHLLTLICMASIIASLTRFVIDSVTAGFHCSLFHGLSFSSCPIAKQTYWDFFLFGVFHIFLNSLYLFNILSLVFISCNPSLYSPTTFWSRITVSSAPFPSGVFACCLRASNNQFMVVHGDHHVLIWSFWGTGSLRMPSSWRIGDTSITVEHESLE